MGTRRYRSFEAHNDLALIQFNKHEALFETLKNVPISKGPGFAAEIGCT